MDEQKRLALSMLSNFRSDKAHGDLERHVRDMTIFVEEPQHPRLRARVYPWLSFAQLMLSTRALSKEQRLEWSIKSIESDFLGKYYQVLDELGEPQPAAQPVLPVVKKNKLTPAQRKQAKLQLEQAEKYLSVANHVSALSCYAEALQHHPNCLEALKGRASVALALDKDDQFLSDIDILQRIDRLFVRKLMVVWNIKRNKTVRACQELKEIVGRLEVHEFFEIMTMLVEANELNIVREYCVGQLEKKQFVSECILLLERVGVTAGALGNPDLAKACFLQLTNIEGYLPGAEVHYALGSVEAFQGSYVLALDYFIRAARHPGFSMLDELLQRRIEFGLLLSAMKSQQNNALQFNMIQLLLARHEDFRVFINQWIIVELPAVAAKSESLLRIYIVGVVPESLRDVVDEFMRAEEFTRNLISFFAQAQRFNRLDNPLFSWSKIDLEQINAWVEYPPRRLVCGFLALLANPHGMAFFFDTPFFHDKITLSALNEAVLLESNVYQSALSLLVGSQRGKLLLFNNESLRAKISSEGLDAIVGNPKDPRSYLSVLCHWVSHKGLSQLLDSDLSLSEKITTEGFNQGYGERLSMVSPLYLCAKTEFGRGLLHNNSVICGKIMRAGLMDAIRYAQRDHHEPALTCLLQLMKRPEYQSLVLHHRLLTWFPQPAPYVLPHPSQKNDHDFRL